jgi:regulator of sigma E protease
MFDLIPPQYLYMLPAFLIVLTIIVFVHEMGHYLVARWNGIAIHTFSVGFGPELIGRTDKHGTRWRLSAIPLGGYVRFVGDMNAASLPDRELIEQADPELAQRLFVNKNPWQRIAVTAGSVAEAAGLLENDKVLSVDGYQVRGFEDFQRLVATAPQRPVTIVVERPNGPQTIVVTPEIAIDTDRFGNEHRIGRIGVTRSISRDEVTIYKPGPIEAISMTFEEIRFIIDRTLDFLGDFFVGRGDVEQLGGPVKVAKVSGEVASLGIVALINLMALLSLNIGIFNLLPVPMLDGGHLAYYLYEAIRGKPLSQRVQEIGFRFGFALVVTLMIFTTFNDTILAYIRSLS